MSVGTTGIIFVAVGSFALGVASMGWYSGAFTTTGAAADSQQIAVEDAVATAADIGEKDEAADRNARRANNQRRVVAADCPPGRGPVSSGLNTELFDAFTKASPSADSRKAGSGSATE